MIIGAIKKIIKTIFRALYAVISLLNLQFTLFVAVVGLILYLTGVLTGNDVVKVCFIVLIAISLVYALVATLSKLFGLDKREKRVRREKVKEEEGEDYYPSSPTEREYSSEGAEQPRYFRVKQNPNLIMAEYEDRYELYEVDGKNMKKIRTDYK